MLRHYVVASFLFIFSFISYSQVSTRDTSWSWQHFDYELDVYGRISNYSTSNIVSSNFDGIIVENEYLKIVLLPDFGGRILSYIYKPTGQEQLYQNPIGVPYGIDEGNFYFDWLMVYGGIFPTFPEPEHGKTWFLPWETTVLTNTSDEVTIQMSFTDDIDIPHPRGFNNGETGITCHFTVSVYRGRSSIKVNVELINDNDATYYEYWTNGSFAPGSVPGDPKTPGNSEIIAPIERVRLKDDWWSWMGTAEDVISSRNHIFEWDNLRYYNNWDGWGIAYANPSIEENYFGLINHENEAGIFRVADNKNHTIGLKMWTFGYEQSINADMNDFDDINRPFIELWGGTVEEFWYDALLYANQTKTWDEYYLPTVNMPAVSEVNEHAAVFIDYGNYNDSEAFYASFFSTYPDQNLHVKLELLGDDNYILYDETILADASGANEIVLDRSNYVINEGTYQYRITISDADDNELLVDETTYINELVGAKSDILYGKLSVFPNPSNGVFEINLEDLSSTSVQLKVLNTLGAKILQKDLSPARNKINLSNQDPGVYVLKIEEGDTIYTQSIVLY